MEPMYKVALCFYPRMARSFPVLETGELPQLSGHCRLFAGDGGGTAIEGTLLKKASIVWQGIRKFPDRDHAGAAHSLIHKGGTVTHVDVANQS